MTNIQSHFTRETSDVLGLTPLDRTVLRALECAPGPRSVSALSRDLKIPRTTVAFTLSGLHARSLAKRIPVKGHREWVIGDATRITSALSPLLSSFSKEAQLGQINDALVGIEAYRGVRRIEHACERILNLVEGERVYCIQGTLAAVLSIKKIAPAFLLQFHAGLKKRGIIMEGCSGESALSLFHSLSDRELASHQGRATVVSVFPDEYMTHDADIFAFENVSLVVFWKEEIALVIRYAPLVAVLRSLVSLLSVVGRKVDLNKHIEHIRTSRKTMKK